MTHTLFAHLAMTFGSHPENLATEALGFILQKSAPARAGVSEALRACGAPTETELTYFTQATGADDARPDLVGRTPNGTEPLLIEVKFWAGLTQNQPVAYLARLAPGGVLLVVAPAARLTVLWGELRRRCVEAKMAFADRPADLVGAFAATVGERQIVLLSWRSLLAGMQRNVDAVGDRKTAEDIAQLDGLCDRMDTDAFLPVSSEELTTSTYRRIVEFGSIADDVVAKLVDRGGASTTRLRSTAGNGYYGRYLSLRGVGAFLICDVRKWMKFAPTPLWLSVYGPQWTKSNAADAHRALAPYEAAAPGRVFKSADGFPAVALFVPHGVEREAVLASVLAEVEKIGDAIASIGLAATAEPVAPPPEEP
ncbi:MAG: hypothetical protein JWM82_938 [Myxococcales bacterium]|nr:hypothetical protein [Myxococcales bacterium]